MTYVGEMRHRFAARQHEVHRTKEERVVLALRLQQLDNDVDARRILEHVSKRLMAGGEVDEDAERMRQQLQMRFAAIQRLDQSKQHGGSLVFDGVDATRRKRSRHVLCDTTVNKSMIVVVVVVVVIDAATYRARDRHA